MKKPLVNINRLVLFTIAVGYLTICYLFSLSPNEVKYTSYFEAISSAGASSDSILLQSDNDLLSDDKYLLSLKNKRIIADSLLYTLYSENDQTYLIAQIPNHIEKRVLLKLELPDAANINWNEILYKRAVVTADITGVDLLPVYTTLETFENMVIWQNIAYDVVLEGNLSEILYISKI